MIYFKQRSIVHDVFVYLYYSKPVRYQTTLYNLNISFAQTSLIAVVSNQALCYSHHRITFTNQPSKCNVYLSWNDQPNLSTFAPSKPTDFQESFTNCFTLYFILYTGAILYFCFVHNSLMWVGGWRCDIKCHHCWNTCCIWGWSRKILLLGWQWFQCIHISKSCYVHMIIRFIKIQWKMFGSLLSWTLLLATWRVFKVTNSHMATPEQKFSMMNSSTGFIQWERF